MTAVAFQNYVQKRVGTSYRATEGDWLKAWFNEYRVLRVVNNFRFSSNYGVTYSTPSLNLGKPTSELWRTTIFPNGNVVICGADWMVYSDDRLTTSNDCTILDANGDPYVLHTPVDIDYPGTYFNHLDAMATDGRVWVLGNYGCSGKGANPTNIYYSLDYGLTWKIFYTFGQSTNFTDDGTLYGGVGGNLLGDASNEISCRHIHCIHWCQNGSFYVATGDNGTGIGTTGEMHFLKLTYDHLLDEWTVERLLSDTQTKEQKYRANGIFEKDGWVYWSGKSGIFKSPEVGIQDESNHVLIHANVSAYCLANRGNTVYMTNHSDSNIEVSDDLGANWETHLLYGTTQASENPQFNNDEVLLTTSRTTGTIFRYRTP